MSSVCGGREHEGGTRGVSGVLGLRVLVVPLLEGSGDPEVSTTH